MTSANALHKALADARSLAQARLYAGALAVQQAYPGLNLIECNPHFKQQEACLRRLCRIVFRHAGAVLVAEPYADGVLRVKGLRTGMILAVSEPGMHAVLIAGFEALSRSDLAPQIR